MPTLGAPLDFAKLEGRNFVAHQLPSAPSAPVKGQLYFNNTGGDNTLYYFNGTVWIAASAAAGGPPTGAAGGDLSGTYPSPQIAAGVIVDADVAAANKDGAAATPSLRTLGTGPTQAAAGNDSRLSDSRPASGPAGGDLSGTYPNPQIAAGVITDADVAAANKDGVVGTPSLRTLGAGAQQAMPGNRPLSSIQPPIVGLDMNTQRINALGDPLVSSDAATKGYADSVAQGLDVKASVRLMSNGNLTLSGTATVIDGFTPVLGDRVLCTGQTTPAQNGIYIVGSGAWQRATDMDAWAEVPGAFTFVEIGTNFGDTGWVCTSDAGGTIGTTAITWTQFAGAGEYIAGAGLALNTKTFDVGAGAGIQVNADTIQVANNGITNAMIADGAVDLSTADVTGTLPIGKGGTGTTTGMAATGAGYYSTATHGAGTTIAIPKATHGLRASRGLLIQVQDEATGNVELPDVSIAASGDVTVTYAVAVLANSKRVTVIG